ncbi:MAG TPA: radical SAM protein [Nitrospirae bacterium]|nr:radical SAM superfamily protein [bacterium BMS3Abin06]HDH11403.1 radical SAM protein [Nitrospirota bacterium]HDZ01443.1 radical SAM protein [Nitrospirota bacterium]
MNDNKTKKGIYIAQFGTGSTINLLPLAAGLLVSRLKEEKEFLKKYHLGEIIFQRPDNPEEFVASLREVFVMGLSFSLWNMNINFTIAGEVRKMFPDALIVGGGPSIAKDPELVDAFFKEHPYIDVIAAGEGEEAFVSLCKHHDEGRSFDDIPGIIYRNRKTGEVHYGRPDEILQMEKLPSPFLDGTFDDLYEKYHDVFSGMIWETNRGCPFTCSYCTWGNYSSRKIRMNSMERIRSEVEWIGKNNIGYIAMSDANFGIKARDVEIAGMLAECKKKYGVPNFISVSWVKNIADRVLQISDILKTAGIGFRVTMALQSHNEDVVEAVNRKNVKKSTFTRIKDVYHSQRLYSYTELILGLPLETYESFVSGVEKSLSESVFDQVYIYPCFLFPNTQLSSPRSIERYGIKSKETAGGYTKSKGSSKIGEKMDIVVGTDAMPMEKWVDSFVEGYFMTGLHDDRLAFFVFQYLKKTFGIKVKNIIVFMRGRSSPDRTPLISREFRRIERTAENVQSHGESHLMELPDYGGIIYDSPDAVFLDLLYKRDAFYIEMQSLVEMYLNEAQVGFDQTKLDDLFIFQKAVMAHPDGPGADAVDLQYDWIKYFRFAFNYAEEPLQEKTDRLQIIDTAPSDGDGEQFLKNHFNVRGEPAFNLLVDEDGTIVFPSVLITRTGGREYSGEERKFNDKRVKELVG